MRCNLLALLVGFMLVFARQGFAANDVYVDLSALDNLPHDSIGFVRSEPLFPEVKKAPRPVKSKVVKTKKAKPVALKKPEPVKPQLTNETKPSPELHEEDLTEVLPEKDKNTETVILEIPGIPSEEPLEEEKNIASEPSETSQETTSETSPSEQPSELESLLSVEPVEQKEPDSVSPDKIAQEEENEPVEQEEVLPAQPKEIYSFAFDDGISELSEENKRRLDDLINVFSADKKKKISIKAYNYDDGEETFRKKRISLNRATTIRSYFLAHGFKNFSIKMINTTADNEYKNTVDVEEID